MTLFGLDGSHYDGRLSTAILARAKAEGIVFFHHKVGEGLSDTEGSYDDTALAAARDAGIEFLGAYFVPRSLDPAAQVAEWVALLRAGEPWLFDWPGRYAVVDLERWKYDNVQAATGIDCAKRLRAALGWQVFLYASHGQYGDSLTGWDGPLINADYTSAAAAGFQAMYPGDDWQPLHGTWRGGWAPYSGKTPTFLQYTSSATVAGLTTCDVNAYRGTVDQLRALITGTQPPRGRSMIQVKQAGGPTIVLTDWATWCDRTLSYDQLQAMLPAVPRVDVPDAVLQRILALPQPDKMATQTTGVPTQDQVNTAMNDPTWLAKLGAAVASHIHVS